MRQLDAKRASENGDDDSVEKHQNRTDDGDDDGNADNQKKCDSNDCKRIPVCHRATMQAFAGGRQDRLGGGLGAEPVPGRREAPIRMRLSPPHIRLTDVTVRAPRSGASRTIRPPYPSRRALRALLRMRADNSPRLSSLHACGYSPKSAIASGRTSHPDAIAIENDSTLPINAIRLPCETRRELRCRFQFAANLSVTHPPIKIGR